MRPAHSLVPAGDTCCRPTPTYFVQRIPGLAFNFSSILPQRIDGPLNEAERLRDVPRLTICSRRAIFTVDPFHPTAIAC